MEELKKSYALIVQKINDRDQKIQNKENYQVFEREITKNLQTYMETIRQGQDIVQRNKISQEEDQRRMNLLREHLNKHQNLNQKLLNKPTLEIQRSFTKQQERQNNGVELTSTQIVKQQDNQIDALLQTTDKMKLGMKNMGNALDEGKVILKRLDDEVDQNITNTKQTTSRVKGLLDNTNDSCLWIAIIIEFMIFIFLIIY